MTRAHHRPRRPTAGRDRRRHSDPRGRRFGLAAAAVHAPHGPAATSTNQPTSAPTTNPTDWVRKRGRSIKDSETPHRDGILAARRLGLSNARAEALNNKAKLIVRRAYGFHSANAALALIHLTCGPITLTLPHEQAFA